MNYSYAAWYGTGGAHQDRIDKAVVKGHAQLAREDTMRFPALLAKLRHEAAIHARQARRGWTTCVTFASGGHMQYRITADGIVDVASGQTIPLADWWRVQLGSAAS